ncbi:hypothetical protein GYMLUDRAFT_37477 [Collybiopsis luxurians FD-317 M1]|nr:hypothetical protein GYMLUDRAFT_37477 [Collybiopsis luxurians FD-317 M1]
MPSRLIRDLEAASGAALFFLAWDILITLDDEVELIWSKPWNSWIKWAFLVARYFSLVLSLAGRFVELMVTYTRTFHSEGLRIWFGLQGLLAFSIIASAEMVMMARVYALYNKNKWVGYGFIGLLLAELVIAVLGIVLRFPSSSFDPENIPTNTPGSFEWFSIATIISQTVVLVLSVSRYRYMFKNGRWEGTRIVRLIMRDGTLAFAFFFVFLLLAALYNILFIKFAACEFAWTISAVSITECRLILNLEKLPLMATTTFSSEYPELTTIISTESRPEAPYHMTVFNASHRPSESQHE